LKDDTFFAVIWATKNGEPICIDSRPSDALALALRMDCPIYVDETVLKSSKVSTSATERVSAEDLRKWLDGLNDDDLGKYKM
jgi:bifunctional DNase/RNase